MDIYVVASKIFILDDFCDFDEKVKVVVGVMFLEGSHRV